ncbi:methyltransferase domain-containing protein [Geobacter sp.]|uniref:class I SAM-dependent methyltransferase n=1 Tax=Geobacter sp. TaxID=46610 RepID=UPI0026017BC9|nr:methyltransferase domain-containing protein [Geobacter sp.]
MEKKTSGYFAEKFEKLAWIYDCAISFWTFFLGGERRVRGEVIRHAGIREGDRVLDVGCGTGTASFLMAEQAGPEGEVVGIDLAERMIAIARKKLAKSGLGNISFRQANAEDLPFPDSSFDRVTFFAVLHEMNHEGRINALKETCRVLRPGGRVLINDLDAPEKGLGRLLMKLLLLVEGKTASEMLRRGLDAEIGEAAGECLRVVRKRKMLSGLVQVLVLENVAESSSFIGDPPEDL